ncbi:hypothetical protein P3T76_005819 [Phytophthora citrophthora]|uniref:Crinkler effector protein N-terminal domain-containing protein n=1 Tax=Phytophthora citrophthora TaxID=4793 RepID=A0AAD9GR23_9STRA|nr:hypothetical protein P3T76_005819 [Phytophthora citrophthora]
MGVIVGEVHSAFEIDIDEDANVFALKEKIQSSQGLIQARSRHLQLFLAKTLLGARLDEEAANLMTSVTGVQENFKRLDPTHRLSNKQCFGKGFQAGEDDIHVLVVVPTSEPARKRRKLTEEMSTKDLWRLSEVPLDETLSVDDLKLFLQRPLPFQLTLRSSTMESKDHFDPNGPLISCPDLETLLNYFILKTKGGPATYASENSWQAVYDILLDIPTAL